MRARAHVEPSATEQRRRWRRRLRVLRRLLPADRRVVVRRREFRGRSRLVDGVCPRTWGFATRTRRGYQIHVNLSQPFDAQVETLYHEWAHVLAWPGQCRDRIAECHDARHFGAAVARVSRVLDAAADEEGD